MILVKQIIPFRKEIEFKTMITKITGISLEHTLSLKDELTISGDFIVSGTYKMTEASQIEEEFNYKIPVEVNIDGKYDTKDITLDIDDFIYEVIDEEKLSLKIDLSIDNLIEKQDPKEQTIDPFETFESLSLKEETLNNELKEEKEERNEDIENLFLETSKKEDLSIDESIIEPIEEKQTEEIINIENNDIPSMEISTLSSNSTMSTITNVNLITNDSTPQPKVDLNNLSGGVSSIFSAFSNTEETFSTYCVYIVRETDTIDSIVTKYKTTRELLAEYNNLKEIKIGSKIIIPNYQDE